MKTPQYSFRLNNRIIKMMDGLITNPPAAVMDETLGKPRNRTELVERLVERAFEQAKKSKEKSTV